MAGQIPLVSFLSPKCYPNAKLPARQGVLLCIIGMVNMGGLWLRVFGILTSMQGLELTMT